jgi:predicted HTH domain antitoxin
MVKVVLPALSVAESEFEQALGRISLERMAQLAESANANETLKKRA